MLPSEVLSPKEIGIFLEKARMKRLILVRGVQFALQRLKQTPFGELSDSVPLNWNIFPNNPDYIHQFNAYTQLVKEKRLEVYEGCYMQNVEGALIQGGRFIRDTEKSVIQQIIDDMLELSIPEAMLNSEDFTTGEFSVKALRDEQPTRLVA